MSNKDHRLCAKDRKVIANMKQVGKKQIEIAQAIGFSQGTVSQASSARHRQQGIVSKASSARHRQQGIVSKASSARHLQQGIVSKERIGTWKAKPGRKIIGTEQGHERSTWLNCRDNS